MLIEKNLFVSCKKLFFSLSLFAFTLFISLGNLPRFIETSFFSDHLLFSEVLLYFFAGCSLVFIKAPFKSYLTLFCFCLLTLCSFLYGCLIQGFDLHAALYAFRLIAFLITSFSLSYICLEKFKANSVSFFSYLSKGYAISLFFGFLIFLFFFSSELLWKELSLYHIIFHGDPHQGRFLSVYLDPNYYAAIVGIPLLLSLYLYQKTKKTSYAVFFAFLAISSLLTWSRSGLFLIGFLFSFLFLKSLDFRGISSRVLKNFLCLLSCGLFLSLLFFQEMKTFFIRLFFLSQDESALSRLYTFNWGVFLWKERPLFGIGYNFLYKEVKQEIGLNSLDSSLLSLLIQIGAIPFIGLLLYGMYKVQGLKQAIAFLKTQEKEGARFLLGFSLYGGLIIFFSSHFNQLLFYPFWLIPFSVISLFYINGFKERA